MCLLESACSAGETKTLNFSVASDRLAFWDERKKAWVVEPGAFDVMAGARQQTFGSRRSSHVR